MLDRVDEGMVGFSCMNCLSSRTPLPENTQKTSRWWAVNSEGGSRQNFWYLGDMNAGTPVTDKCVSFVHWLTNAATAVSDRCTQYERCTRSKAVSYTHLRAHETPEHLVCHLLLE